MTVQELVNRFPEIPQDLHNEPVLAQFAEACDEILRKAQKPSACSTEHDAGNQFYLKLIGPLSIYRYGLSTREKVLSQLQEILDHQKTDPEGFSERLLTPDTVDKEVKGPGCS
ncbi:MAG TPA: hypothetical protein VGB26_02015 [Nitrospiria bacterium]|jgi:hypothetical protein